MFQFTTTTILNSNQAVDVRGNVLLDAEGNDVPKFKNEGDKLHVHGTGTFNGKNILSVYRRNGKEGALGEVTLTVPEGTQDVLRLRINIKLTGKTQSDYTNYYGDFARPVVVDILKQSSAAKNAEEFARVLNSYSFHNGHPMVSVTQSSEELTIKGKDEGQIISAELFEVDSSDALQPKEILLKESETSVEGHAGFGNTNWMLRSVTLPTYDNTRHFGVNRDERPIVGDLYDQFTVRYIVDAGEDDIFNAGKKSITTHVFWVNQDISGAFDTAIKAVFPDVEIVSDNPKENFESNPGGAIGSDDDTKPDTGVEG